MGTCKFIRRRGKSYCSSWAVHVPPMARTSDKQERPRQHGMIVTDRNNRKIVRVRYSQFIRLINKYLPKRQQRHAKSEYTD